jgi:hypothetical protein
MNVCATNVIENRDSVHTGITKFEFALQSRFLYFIFL